MIRIQKALLSVTFALFLFVFNCLHSPLALASPPRQSDATDWGGFFDSYFERLEREHVPGGVAVVARGGEILFARGYGHANVERAVPVSPEETLFRVGSISKLLTTVAVLQLVEKGALDLNASVERYLPDSRLRGITLTHLLTHTDGFDVGWGIGSLVKRESDRVSLGEVVRKRLPPRILPPGKIFLYGDVGMVVAGRIVEKVSGMPFERYVRENLLDPLDMRSSTFDQPLPSALQERLATGYQFQNGKYEARPFAYSNSAPAAGLSATGLDMARFLSANLQGGRYGGRQILRPDTVTLMHEIHFRHYPELAGSALGFYETRANGKKVLDHGGRLNGYTSRLFLLPEEKIGVFVAVNANTDTLGRLLPDFLNAYYPRAASTPSLSKAIVTVNAPDRRHLELLEGNYRFNRYPHTTLAKLAAPLGEAPEIRVKVKPDNSLDIGASTGWVEGEPGLFYGPEPGSRTRFRFNNKGFPEYLFGVSPFDALERLKWYESSPLHLTVILLLAFYFSGVLAFETISLGKRFFRWENSRPKLSKMLVIMKFIVTGSPLLFLVSISLFLYFTDFWNSLDRVPLSLLIILLFPLLSLSATIGLSILSIYHWKKTGIVDKLSTLSLFFFSFLFLSILHYWNLLGYRL